jgi:hypothetical protein
MMQNSYNNLDVYRPLNNSPNKNFEIKTNFIDKFDNSTTLNEIKLYITDQINLIIINKRVVINTDTLLTYTVEAMEHIEKLNIKVLKNIPYCSLSISAKKLNILQSSIINIINNTDMVYADKEFFRQFILDISPNLSYIICKASKGRLKLNNNKIKKKIKSYCCLL